MKENVFDKERLKGMKLEDVKDRIDGFFDDMSDKTLKHLQKELKLMNQKEMLEDFNVKKDMLIKCVAFCLNDNESITVEQMVDNFLLNTKIPHWADKRVFSYNDVNEITNSDNDWYWGNLKSIAKERGRNE